MTAHSGQIGAPRFDSDAPLQLRGCMNKKDKSWWGVWEADERENPVTKCRCGKHLCQHGMRD